MERSENISRALKQIEVPPMSDDFNSRLKSRIAQKERETRRENIILIICAVVCVLLLLGQVVAYFSKHNKLFVEIVEMFRNFRLNVSIVFSLLMSLIFIGDMYLRRYLNRHYSKHKK